MVIEKTKKYNDLYDIYQNLLTDKQKQTFENVYFYDLSLSEIAQNENISRAAAFDMLKRVEAILDDYESKLNLLERKEKIKAILDENTYQKIKEML